MAIVNLTSGGLSGGYRKYLQALVPLLSVDPRIRHLSVFVPPGAHWPRLDAETFSWAEREELAGFRKVRQHILEMAPDVVFIPTARWLDCGSIPVVIMVRNMEPLLVPCEGNPLMTKAKNMARSWVARHACRKAARVIAVSEHVRDFLTERWRIPAGRVGVVTHGIDAKTRPTESIMPASLEEMAGAYIFTAGSIRPARGLHDIIEAMARIKARGLPYQLVVGGSPSPDSAAYAASLKRLAAAQGVTDRIFWAGQLNPAEMAWCFTNCAAFVMTSWAEACPNTLLEALSYGCLSISTDQPPMPEFFGDSAYYYPARDGGALAERLVEALSAPAPAQQARRAAAAIRAERYNWNTTAERTLQELEMALRGETNQ